MKPADSDEDKSVHKLCCLQIISEQYLTESFKIFSSFELTKTLDIFFDFNAAFMDQYIRGILLIFIKFLFLIPFEPFLARIIDI